MPYSEAQRDIQRSYVQATLPQGFWVGHMKPPLSEEHHTAVHSLPVDVVAAALVDLLEPRRSRREGGRVGMF